MKTIMIMLLAAATGFAGDTGDDAARKLETKVSLNFRGAKMTEVLEVFRSVTGLNFLAIDGAETTVTLSVRDLSAKSALKLILQPAGLGAGFEHGSVVIRSRESLAGATTLRIYDVRSKMAKLRDFNSDRLGFGPPDGYIPKVDFIVLIPNFQTCCRLGGPFIIEFLRENSGGRSWDQDPRVSFNLVNDLLFVTQTAPVHREIEALLERLPN